MAPNFGGIIHILKAPGIVIGEYRFGLIASRKQRMLEPLLDRLEQESFVLPASPWHGVVRSTKTAARDMPNTGSS